MVRWRKRVPDLFDIGNRDRTQARHRGLCQTRRYAYARRAADELQERPPFASITAVEHVLYQLTLLGRPRGNQRAHHVAEPGRLTLRRVGCRP